MTARASAAVPTAPAIPKALTGLLAKLAEAHWSYTIRWGRDSADALYTSVEAAPYWGGPKIQATWHTRGTGSLRLFSCMIRDAGTVQQHDVTLKTVMAAITAEPARSRT